MSEDLVHQLFGPMSKFYCNWFFYLSVFGFVLFTIAVIAFLMMAVSKKQSSKFYFQMFMVCLGYFVFYFQNRLLYSMCGNTTY
jgi:hypothetical protein